MQPPRTRDHVFGAATASRFDTCWLRAWAFAIDILLFWLLSGHFSRVPTAGLAAPPHAVLSIALGLLPLVYSILFHAWFGQTVGKWIMGVQVLDVSERPLTLRRAAVRDSVVAGLTSVGLAASLASPGMPSPAEMAGMELAELFAWGEQFNHWSTHVATAVTLGWIAWYALELAAVTLDDRRRAFHDLIAGTVVVRTRTRRPRLANPQVSCVLLLAALMAGVVWLLAR